VQNGGDARGHEALAKLLCVRAVDRAQSFESPFKVDEVP
jgi:hypothetical protein